MIFAGAHFGKRALDLVTKQIDVIVHRIMHKYRVEAWGNDQFNVRGWFIATDIEQAVRKAIAVWSKATVEQFVRITVVQDDKGPQPDCVLTAPEIGRAHV